MFNELAKNMITNRDVHLLRYVGELPMSRVVHLVLHRHASQYRAPEKSKERGNPPEVYYPGCRKS